MKDYWIISLGTFTRYGIYASIQTLYAGPYLMLVRGISPVAAGNIILLMNIGFILGGPIFGTVSDRFLHSRKWIVVPGLACLALIIHLMAVVPEGICGAVIPTLFFLLGLANSTGGIMYSQIKERVPLENAGAAMTGINFFTMTGPAIFLQGLGIFMQSGYEDALGAEAFRGSFTLCSACLLLTAVIYLLTTDTGRRSQE